MKYPTKKELAKEYDEHYTKNPKKWSGEARDLFCADVVKKYDPMSILDVGCGNGHSLKVLGDAFPNAELFGIDISPVGCQLAKQNTRAKIDCVFLDKFDPDIIFDLVICLGTVEHLKDPLESLKKMKELGNLVYLELPHNLLYSEGKEGFRRLTTRSQQLEWHYTREKWEEIIKEAGFEIVESLVGPNAAWEFIWTLK
jgi:trans-aconitate methyltransferase